MCHSKLIINKFILTVEITHFMRDVTINAYKKQHSKD